MTWPSTAGCGTLSIASSSCFDEETEKAFRRKELTEKLEEAGFRIKEYTPIGYVAYMVLGQTDVLKFFQNLQNCLGRCVWPGF